MWRRARETDGAGSAVLHDEDVQSSNDEAGRSVSDALQQLKHNHANLMREKKQIEQYAADIEHDVRTPASVVPAHHPFHGVCGQEGGHPIEEVGL